MRSAIKFAGLVAAVLWSSAVWAGNPGVIQGVVKSGAGQPVAGAYVKLRNAEKALTIMVVSQEQGRYTVSNLPVGKYTAQAIGGELESKQAPVDVTGSKAAVADLSLSEQRAPALAPGWPGTPGTVGGAEVWNKMPPAVLPDGPGKEIAESKCAQCHVTRWFAGFRGNREGWATLIDSMRSNIAATPNRATDFSDEEIAKLTDYFATYMSKPRPDTNSRLPRTLVKGKEAKYVIVDYKIRTIGSEPHEMAVDSTGHGWVGERNGGKIGKFDPQTYEFTEVEVPKGASPRNRIGAIIHGNGDTLWMNDGGPNHRWIEYNTKSGAFRTFAVPSTIRGMGNGNTIRQHPNGTVWLASGAANGMVSLDPATGKFTVYESPAGIANKRSVGPYGFSFDAEGNVWFAEFTNNSVGRVDIETGKVDDFPIPIKGSIPRKVSTDQAGNIWVALHETGQILKVDYKNPSNMKGYLPPSEHPGTYSPAGDLKNGYIWVSLQGTDKIARFDPKTETWLECAMPTPESDVRRIEVDRTNPNRVWWTGTLSNHMGYLELLDK